MSIGSFTLIKNESMWIEQHLNAWLPYLDQMVFFDGNSKDGTLEILLRYEYENDKIIVKENKDPLNLQDDYVKLFNECLHTLDTEFALFIHPDMFPISGAQNLKEMTESNAVAAYTHMRVFAGNPMDYHISGKVLEETGRAKGWKNIMRLRNPDLGLHYFGHYGAANEDMYFEAITGDNHEFYGDNFTAYPYPISDSHCVIAHYSDVRPYERRFQRMVSSLKNQGYSKNQAENIAKTHPRVTLKSGDGMEFKEVKKECLF